MELATPQNSAWHAPINHTPGSLGSLGGGFADMELATPQNAAWHAPINHTTGSLGSLGGGGFADMELATPQNDDGHIQASPGSAAMVLSTPYSAGGCAQAAPSSTGSSAMSICSPYNGRVAQAAPGSAASAIELEDSANHDITFISTPSSSAASSQEDQSNYWTPFVMGGMNNPALATVEEQIIITEMGFGSFLAGIAILASLSVNLMSDFDCL